VVFVEDIKLKARALDENPPIKGVYQTAENPIFKIFYIDVEEVIHLVLPKDQKLIRYKYWMIKTLY